ncbi:MAG: IS110 family transposase [Hydrogeniiclostridium sp.]
MNPLFVGIDVSSRSNVAYLMKPDGSKHSSFSVQNNLGGAKLLSEKIVSALSSMQLSDVVIGLEATSIYGDSLVYALREDGSLGRFQRKIHVLNPKQVKKFKEAYPDLPKNDFVDAFVIADHLRFGRIAKEVHMDDYRYQALRTLTRARFDVIQNLTREKQRFANYLFLKCSGIAQDKVIQNTSATTIALVERFETVDDLANADLDELTAFLDEKGRNFADPAAKAKALRSAARDSYRLPVTVNNSVNQAKRTACRSGVQALFQKLQRQGLVWCCLFAAYSVLFALFHLKFPLIAYLTSYHWTSSDGEDSRSSSSSSSYSSYSSGKKRRSSSASFALV